MKVIDFRFRPNTPEIINGIKNSTMFKAACEVIGFDRRKPQPLDRIVADLDDLGVELGVITGRDAETTYGFPANNNSVLEFCRAYPEKFVGLWGIDPHKKMAAVREIEKVVWASGASIPTRRWPPCARSRRSSRNTACRVSPSTPIWPTCRQ